MIAKLKEPYPFHFNPMNRALMVVSISFLIFLVLLVFQPFGLSSLQDDIKLWILGGYGLVCMLILGFNMLVIPLIFKQAFNEKSWTLLSEILFIGWNFFTIGGANLLFSVALGLIPLSIEAFLLYQVITFAVGALPVAVIVLIGHNRHMNENLRKALELNHEMERFSNPASANGEGLVLLNSDNERENLHVRVKDLLYMMGARNYVEVFYLEDGPQKMLLRATMKQMEKQLKPFPQFVRCHRSYIVNLANVRKVTGNSQGYRLLLGPVKDEIPASRSYAEEILQRLKTA